MDARVRSMLVWLIMAAFCGLIGFAIVYYYATNVRPMERFAIVIDAGSTQTRSNLFKISIEAEDFEELADSDEAGDQQGAGQMIATTPLGDLIKVQQVSSCVNGGPMAAITSEQAAQNLIKKCLVKFSDHIKLLDFLDVQNKLREEDDEDDLQPAAGTESMDADDVSKQMALINHRVNSITHLHLGATAGMRALDQLNSSKAEEKLAWMQRAIAKSNSMLGDNSPYINRGYVGILNGSDEATFGWLSVNFVCNALNASAVSLGTRDPLPQSVDQANQLQTSSVVYQLENSTANISEQPVRGKQESEPFSVGTLELGGASAQMAFQVADNLIGARQIKNMSIEEQQLDLFNGHYKLAARSDLCLGMSQAVLRLNYVLLHKTMNFSSSNFQSPVIRTVNACMQMGSLIRIKGDDLAKLWQGACLVPNEELGSALLEHDRIFRLLITSKETIEFSGSGNVDQCNVLLNELIEPNFCKRYFSLCPESKNKAMPPKNMSFVTISGYNHALNVLNLNPIVETANPSGLSATEARWARLNMVIDDKLGGNAISYSELLEKTRTFCSTQVSDIPKYYPKVNKQFQDIICLQLVYIRKLLTEFYLFDPETQWGQIKFLIFNPKSEPEQYTRVVATNSASVASTNQGIIRPDIGWTLGLLLNVTSEQLISGDQNEIYYHHGATVMYIVRAIILIMLACFMIAIALLVVGIIEVRLAQERGEAYIAQTSSRSSSYDIRTLSEITSPDERIDTLDGTLVRVQRQEQP